MGKPRGYAHVDRDPELRRAMLDFQKRINLEDDGQEGYGLEPRPGSPASGGASDSARDKIPDRPMEEE